MTFFPCIYCFLGCAIFSGQLSQYEFEFYLIDLHLQSLKLILRDANTVDRSVGYDRRLRVLS